MFRPGGLLTSVIDMFMFYREFLHQFVIVSKRPVHSDRML